MTYDPYNPKQPGDPYGQPGPYGQQPMYGYGYPPVVPKPQTSAILSLVLSIVGFATCGVTSIVGIVFGHIALKKIKRGEEDGHGLAIAGVIIGYVVTIAYALFVLFYLGILVAVISGNTY